MRKFRCIEDLDLSTGNVKKGDIFDFKVIDLKDAIVRNNGSFICHVNSAWGKQYFEEIIEEINPKDLLENGMIVELRNGKRYLVLKGDLQANPYGKQDVIFVGKHGYIIGSDYDSNLNDTDTGTSWDICKVLKIDHYGSFDKILRVNNYDLIWERKEPKTVKMSAVDILEKLGYSKDDKLEIIID